MVCGFLCLVNHSILAYNERVEGLWFLSGSALDTVANFVGLDIPFGKTASLMATIYLANHPKNNSNSGSCWR